MKNNPLVSIIIPAYNAEKTIFRCIESLLMQTYDNLEIIIVNDCSEDRTRDIVLLFDDRRIRLLDNLENAGISLSRNRGIDESSGQYIMFCDADDTFTKTAVEKLVFCCYEYEVTRFATYDIFSNRKIKRSLESLSGRLLNTTTALDKKKVYGEFFGVKANQRCLVMALFIKKEFLVTNSIRFEQNLNMMEDVIFYVDIFRKCKEFYFYNEPLYNYFILENSTSHSKAKAIKIANGIYEANVAFNKRVRDKSINAAHFRALTRCLIWNYEVSREIRLLEKASMIAQKSDLSSLPFFWKTLGRAILANNKLLVKVLFRFYIIKDYWAKR